ncbi:photosystem ii reaction center w protein chloroplastic [Phtheirospermum japonicum]|uniref:PSII 6.1 kDa protein n=1 Tax=Phtheirospermum japonicum TaxID=374723 RepID=A0A830BH27_9LAMI|nr:photosystem ii reaction center w protein chloroplastic [Phtheirospermum japonicum]
MEDDGRRSRGHGRTAIAGGADGHHLSLLLNFVGCTRRPRAEGIPRAPIHRSWFAIYVKEHGEVRCSMEGKAQESEAKVGMGASLMAAAMPSPAAMVLVDDRMSTEGTGLPFGLSNNLLGWIIFGVFGLI